MNVVTHWFIWGKDVKNTAKFKGFVMLEKPTSWSYPSVWDVCQMEGEKDWNSPVH